MSRPKPNVLLSYTDRASYNTEQVLESSYVYVVCYKDKPVNLKVFNPIDSSISPTYKRTSFVGNAGHAHNLVDKLNELFKTKDFSVHKMSDGVKVTRNDTK